METSNPLFHHVSDIRMLQTFTLDTDRTSNLIIVLSTELNKVGKVLLRVMSIKKKGVNPTDSIISSRNISNLSNIIGKVIKPTPLWSFDMEQITISSLFPEGLSI